MGLCHSQLTTLLTNTRDHQLLRWTYSLYSLSKTRVWRTEGFKCCLFFCHDFLCFLWVPTILPMTWECQVPEDQCLNQIVSWRLLGRFSGVLWVCSRWLETWDPLKCGLNFLETALSLCLPLSLQLFLLFLPGLVRTRTRCLYSRGKNIGSCESGVTGSCELQKKVLGADL